MTEQLGSGEAVEFRVFVETRSRSLLRAAWLLTGDWSAAEDLVQNALMVTWTRWSRLSRPDAPELYVHRVMLRTFLRWRRRRWNGEVASPSVDSGAIAGHDDAVDVRESVAAALAVLSERQRAVIVLRFFLDLPESQTAAALGCSTGAVKTHTSRALNRLRSNPSLADLMSGGTSS